MPSLLGNEGQAAMSRIKCEVCGDKFDPASLTEVAIHLHDGWAPNDDIVGEEIDGS